ncbi:MAG: M1 family metallopeptidase [Bacteroidota bacterium]
MKKISTHASFWLLLLIIMYSASALAQQGNESKAPVFTRADTLRGMLTAERKCYDVKYYHLDVKIDTAKQFINGSNTIVFSVDSAFDRMQVDLFKNMDVEKITLDDNAAVPFDREFNAVFVKLPKTLKKNSIHSIKIFYSGSPTVAKNPPWDGGFTWTHDSSGNPWVVVTCQGTGASLWWPNKDHQSDKPDSMLISITVPHGLADISNGRLCSVTELAGGWTRYDWFVSYPINNYNVTVNVGKFAHFADTYISGGDALTLDYYVLPENVEKAKVQFRDAKSMLGAFEACFGKYPFIRDGYKLVECPHTGMEHQTAVAYGNRYLEGYRGRASSEVGLKFDFIIVHESAHEWWGNSVTSKDIADMWIHESFGAYAEALYVEKLFGRKESLTYINGKKQNVRNTEPIIGIYNVQHEGSGDMYDKGQLVLNTLRSVIDNDSLWFSILHGIQESFRYQTITADDVVQFVNKKTGKDYSYFFNQYLKFPKIPQLEVFVWKKGDKVTARYKWSADALDFRMPVKVTTSEDRYEFIYPTTSWQTMTLGDIRPENFKVAEDLFYVGVKLNYSYVDPRLTR